MLRRVPVTGGSAIPVVEDPQGGADWGPDNTIVLGSSEGLLLVPALGGEASQLTTISEGEGGHYSPRFLPDGRAILFHIWTGRTNSSQVAVYEFDTEQWRMLLPGVSPQFAASGHLVFWNDNSLWAVPFDPSRLEVEGSPVLVAQNVSANPRFAWYGISDSGTMAYVPAGQAGFDQRSLVWVDRNGVEEPLGADARSAIKSAPSSVKL